MKRLLTIALPFLFLAVTDTSTANITIGFTEVNSSHRGKATIVDRLEDIYRGNFGFDTKICAYM